MAAIAEPIGLNSRQYLCRLRQAKDREVVSGMIKSVLESYGLCYEPNAADEDAILVEKYFEGDRGEFWVVPGGRHGRKDCRVFGVLRESQGRKMR